jgi:hypothetical protein
VQFTLSALYDPNGSVTLQAATLATNVPPNVSLVQPTNNQPIASEGNIPLQASATDSDGSITLVEFFQGATKIGDTAVNPYALVWSNVTAGTYTLTAAATDNDGARTTSLPVDIVVPTNRPPTVNIFSPMADDNFSLPTNVIISASAGDIDGSVTNVKFFVDGLLIGASQAPVYSSVWTNPSAGIHDLTAQATDNRGARTLSVPVTVYVTTNGGSLMGAVLSISSGEQIDLTSDGTNDWAHWGLFTQNSFNHKAGVVSRIPTFTPVQADPVEYFPFADNACSYTWYDGTPFTAVTNSPTGVYVVGLGTGFELTIPARTNMRTLKVYGGAFAARGKLVAYLNDFSAPIYVDSSLDNFGNGPNVVYTVKFASASNSRSLKVRYTAAETHAGLGNVTLQAATLSTGNAPPYVNITTPTNNTAYSLPATLSLNADAFDVDGSVTNVEFFQGTNKLGQATNNPYSLAWTNVAAGSYVLTARATDNQGEPFTSLPVNVYVTGTGGVLRATLDAPANPVDLTWEGSTDWSHWGVEYVGHGPPGFFNHKRNVPQMIPDATKVGSSDFLIFTDNINAYTWTDGTPIFSTNTTFGIYKNNLGEGFQLAIPADTSLRRVKLFVGAYAAQGRLEATLSDSSAAPLVDTSVMTLNTTSAVYTIVYAAASAGKKLNLKYTSANLYDEAYGNVTLQAVSLASAQPRLSILSPMPPDTFAFTFRTDRNFYYFVQSENALSPTNWQTLTNYFGDGLDASFAEPIGSNRVYRVKMGL